MSSLDPWVQFSRDENLAQSCFRTNYRYQGGLSDLVNAVGWEFLTDRLTVDIVNRFGSHLENGNSLTATDRTFIRDAFNGWFGRGGVDDDAVKGDIAEAVFLELRMRQMDGMPVRYRKKVEALSSKTSGWDVLEVFLTTEPWFVLWEAKGTDSAVYSQASSARRELNLRSGPWLAKLSRLLEDELRDSDGPDAAAFAATLHERAFKKDSSFHAGIALVVDDGSFPPPDWEIFGTAPTERDNNWGTVVGLPSFGTLRDEVRKWILDQP